MERKGSRANCKRLLHYSMLRHFMFLWLASRVPIGHAISSIPLVCCVVEVQEQQTKLVYRPEHAGTAFFPTRGRRKNAYLFCLWDRSDLSHHSKDCYMRGAASKKCSPLVPHSRVPAGVRVVASLACLQPWLADEDAASMRGLFAILESSRN